MSTPSPVELAAWISCLFFLVAGWNQVERFLERRSQKASAREIQPQPLAITQVDQPVTESLCQSRRREIRGELSRLDLGFGSLKQERRTDVSELQQQINKVDREVGELRASMALTNQQLMRIDAKLDRMFERENQ